MSKRITFTFALVALALLSCSSAYTNNEFNLKDLIDNNGSFVVGDKLFSNFVYTKNGDGMADAALITVVGIIDPSPWTYGISFRGGWGFVGSPGGQNLQTAFIGYDVEILPNYPDYYIVDNHMRANPTVLVGGDGTVRITETLFDWPGLNSIEDVNIPGKFQKVVFANRVNGVIDPLSTGSDLMNFLPQKKIRIEKDLLFESRLNQATGQWGSVSLSFIDQTFSQIPEPAFFQMGVLASLGGLGLLRMRSNIRK